jgi:predicted dehydrogenase
MRRLTVVGSQKMLVYDDIAADKVILYDKGVAVPPYSDTLEEFQMSYRHGPETIVPFEWREPLRAECEAFVNWIQTGQRACSDAWVGVKVVQVLETAQKSLLNGGGREMISL